MRAVILFLVSLFTFCCSDSNEKVTVYHIDGELKFTDTYVPGASVCLPAAYTSILGEIEGLYRIDGVTHGRKTLKERVSIHPKKGLVIGMEWVSDNGFQQHVLVKNGQVKTFKDKRKFRRRALCCSKENPSKLFIVESNYKMTMNEFAQELAKLSYNAVNLDMGRWGFGWIGDKYLMPGTIIYKGWQTNWIYCM